MLEERRVRELLDPLQHHLLQQQQQLLQQHHRESREHRQREQQQQQQQHHHSSSSSSRGGDRGDRDHHHRDHRDHRSERDHGHHQSSSSSSHHRGEREHHSHRERDRDREREERQRERDHHHQLLQAAAAHHSKLALPHLPAGADQLLQQQLQQHLQQAMQQQQQNQRQQEQQLREREREQQRQRQQEREQHHRERERERERDRERLREQQQQQQQQLLLQQQLQQQQLQQLEVEQLQQGQKEEERKQFEVGGGCPLPKGWVREEIVRQTGLSAGKIDVCYHSPNGKKFWSKPQLSRFLGDSVDLSTFDFRTGKMNNLLLRKNKKHRPHTDYSRGARSDASLLPPIRQTASIFKQPVTVHKTQKLSTVKVDFKHGHQEKPKQLFWEKRLEGLRSCDISGIPLDVLDLPKGVEPVGPNIHADTVLQSVATALHCNGQPITGQTMPRPNLETNPGVYINPEQPLIQAVNVRDDDILSQEQRVLVARKKLEEALKAYDIS